MIPLFLNIPWPSLIKTQTINVHAREDTRLAMIGGERFNKRFIEWNFVSSQKQRLTQAKLDWQEGRFAKVPGDEKEYIPLPE